MARWSMISTAIAGLLSLVTSLTLLPMLDDASRFLDGTITEAEFSDAYVVNQTVSTLQSVAAIAAGILTVIWMYRVARNLRAASRRTTFSPMFAIFGWVLPPFLFVLPLLMLREMWKASDSATPLGDERWREQPVAPMLYVWFAVYGVVSGLLSAVVAVRTVGSMLDNGLSSTDSVRVAAESLEAAGPLSIAAGGVSIVAAVVWVVFVKQLTERHVELTGEI